MNRFRRRRLNWLILLAVTAPATPADIPALRAQVGAQLQALRDQSARAAAAGIDVARERVTIITAERFLQWTDWDSAHPEALRAAVAAWWRVKEEAEALSRSLPAQELRDVLAILDAAAADLAAVRKRPESRRPVPPLDTGDLVLRGPYFRRQGRPIFLSSFVWMPDEPDLNEAYGEIAGFYLAPSQLRADGTWSRRTDVPPRNPHEPAGYVFLGHSGMPAWVREAHPDITVGARHFTAYDIDHPATRQVWTQLLAQAVPPLTGRHLAQAGTLLANEPHWFSAAGEWATGPVSGHTTAHFRTWLRERHGDIATLNGLWGTTFPDFPAVTLEIPIDPQLQGGAAWYDWCRFNMARVTDWFDFLKTEIRRHDPDARVHIKLIPSHFARGQRSHGLDFEALARLQDILGCDAKIVRSRSWRDHGDWDRRYACDWRDLSLTYDFLHSLAPQKLIFDSEFHGLSTVHWREPNLPAAYVRCVYWLAHLHGLGMNQTWYWGREPDGAPKAKSASGFYGSNLTQPRVMNACGRTLKELNAFAPEVVALATAPRPIRLFYSETTAIQDATYMDHVFAAYRALTHSGLPLGFATAGLLAKTPAETLRRWPVLVVAHADRVTRAERTALTRYAAAGGTLLVVGEQSLLRDPYGRPHEGPLAVAPERLHRVDETTLRDTVLAHLRRAGVTPGLALSETNATGQAGCLWRSVPWQDGRLLIVLNLGRGTARVRLDAPGPCLDLITNRRISPSLTLAPYDVRLLHLPSRSDGSRPPEALP